MKLIIKGKIIIESESGVRINSRVIDLLRTVRYTGSLNTAAKTLEISYSHAWYTVFKINCLFNSPLIIATRGGRGGGQAVLTEKGNRLIEQYDEIKINLNAYLQKLDMVFVE